MDFEGYLSKIDMMPPLWPSAPHWPTDDRLLDQLLSQPPLNEMGRGGFIKMVLGSAKEQRASDARWRHLWYAERALFLQSLEMQLKRSFCTVAATS